MIDKGTLVSAYVLHTRPFSNTSLIVDLFTEPFGRVSVLAKSARGPRSRFRGQLQAFSLLLVSWSGKRELKYLTHLELTAVRPQLKATNLFSAFYLNELLVNLLQAHDPHPRLFCVYDETLAALRDQEAVLEKRLRLFEKSLLKEIGVGFSLNETADQTPIMADQYYHFVPEHGFILAKDKVGELSFLGTHLLSFHDNRFDTPEALRVAKVLMRLAINKELNGRLIAAKKLLL